MSKIDDLIRIMDINEITLWTVTKGTGDNNKVFETSDQVTLDERKNKFREVMQLYTGGNFVLMGKRAKTDTRGLFKLEFDNIDDSKQASSIGTIQQPAQIQGIPADEVERRIAEAIARNDEKRRYTEIENENRELKTALKETETVTNRVLKKVEPYIGQIIPFVINKFIPSAPSIQVAGIERDDEYEVIEKTEDNKGQAVSQPLENNVNEIRLQTALEKWSAADPDFISLIEAVAEMAHTGDAMYGMAKNMLKK